MLETQIMFAIKNLRFRYYLIVLAQTVYQSTLIVSIFIIKRLLYGRQPTDYIDLYDLLPPLNPTFKNSVIEFQIKTKMKGEGQEGYFTFFHYPDQHFAFQLNRLFIASWYAFLVILGIYCVLLVARIIQYSLPTLRTKSILTFVDDQRQNEINYRILDCLNYKVDIFYFLYEIANSVDQIKLVMLLNQLDFSEENSKSSGKNLN